MSKQTTLNAVKKAMNTTGKANLALTVGMAIEALTDEDLELIEENALAIEALANSIIDRAQKANREKAQEQWKGDWQ